MAVEAHSARRIHAIARFDREIVVGVPDERGRREILGIHTRGMPLDDNVDLGELSRTTYGFVGADLAALTREAAIDSVRRIMPRIDLSAGSPSANGAPRTATGAISARSRWNARSSGRATSPPPA